MTTSDGDWVGEDSFSYRWYRCPTDDDPDICTPVGEGKTYVLRTADIGRYMRSEVIASNADGSTARKSSPEGPIEAAPPVNTVRPRVTGTPRRELSLGTTAGTWSGRVAGDPGFTYQWQRCSSRTLASCSSVPGATSTTYPLGTADIGRYVRVVVGAEGLGRAQAGAPDTPIGPVSDLPPDPEPGLRRLSPFPVLVIAGRLRGRTTRITDFVVRGPRRAKVSVRCKGRRCPFRWIGGTVGKRKRLRFRRAQRTFRTGQTLELRVTGRNRIGKFTRIRFRRGRAPRRADLCLMPAARKPTRCAGA